MNRALLVSLLAFLIGWGPGGCGGRTPPAPVVTPPAPPSPPLSWDAGPPQPLVPPAPSPTVPPAPSPPSPPPPVGDAYDSACANEKALGCSAGLAADCAASMRNADKGHITHVPVACLTSAKSLVALKACGFVTCTAQQAARP